MDARFDRLQERMAPIDAAMRARRGRRTMVVVPSRALERWYEHPAETQAYEERLLCLLLMLRDPGLSVLYVTSAPVAPAIVDYYLSLLPPAARTRLTMIAAGDRAPRPLSAKLLERPRLLTQVRWSIRDRALAFLLPYMTTEHERDLALALDMPLHGPDPRLAHLGTKSGGRELFAQAGVPHPPGIENVCGRSGAIDAIARMRAAKPDLAEVVVKLDAGVSGEGNAIVDLRGLPGHEDRRAIAARLDRMTLEAGGVSVHAFLSRLTARGGVVEERIAGRDVRSPSVQLEIAAGAVEAVSTHDQVLDGQTYVGCRFPAATAYASAITELATRIGRRLAGAGAIGRCAVDFVVVRGDDGRWHPYAIELNLRRGGTTHPLATLELLTGGAYDPRTATFRTPSGARKHYLATDHLEAPLGRDDVLGLVRSGRVGYDHLRQRGVVFHMLSSLDELGFVGLTAVGDDPLDAQRRYEHARLALLEASARVAEQRGHLLAQP